MSNDKIYNYTFVCGTLKLSYGLKTYKLFVKK